MSVRYRIFQSIQEWGDILSYRGTEKLNQKWLRCGSCLSYALSLLRKIADKQVSGIQYSICKICCRNKELQEQRRDKNGLSRRQRWKTSWRKWHFCWIQKDAKNLMKSRYLKYTFSNTRKSTRKSVGFWKCMRV